METLYLELQQMSVEHLVEATFFVTNNIDHEQFDYSDLNELVAAPHQHIDEIKIICQLILINAAANPDLNQLVNDALANTGKKNFVLGSNEIAAILTGLTVLIFILRTPKDKEEITYFDERGKKVTIKRSYQSASKFVKEFFNGIHKIKDLFENK